VTGRRAAVLALLSAGVAACAAAALGIGPSGAGLSDVVAAVTGRGDPARATILLDVLKAVLPAETPRLADAALDGRAIGFAIAVSLASALVAALLPAWHAARHASAADLRDGGRGTTAGRSRSHLP